MQIKLISVKHFAPEIALNKDLVRFENGLNAQIIILNTTRQRVILVWSHVTHINLNAKLINESTAAAVMVNVLNFDG